MPIIPNYNPVQGTLQPQAPSLGAAMAAGNAVARIGGAASNVGEDLSAVAQRQQAEADQDARNTARLAAQQARQEHELYRAENPDESTWQADAESRFSKVGESYKDAKISGKARQQLDEEVKGWGTTFNLGTQTDAKNQWRAKARTRGSQLVDAYAQAGKWDDAERQLAENESSGLFSKGELDPDREDLTWRKTKWQEDEAEKKEMNGIAEDPAGWWEKHKDKPPAGMDPTKYQRFRGYAKQRLAERTYEDADVIEDAMANGKIKTPEDIDRMGPDLRPSVREQLKANLAKRQSAAFQDAKDDPKYQAAVIGRAGALLADWQPAAEDFDKTYAKILGLVKSLPTGSASREALESQISNVRSGRLGEVRTHADAARKSLDDALKSGRFGKIPEPRKQTTREIVEDGFLKDVAKLQRLGFSASQAESIGEAAADPAAGQKKFIELWKDRDTGSVLADETELAGANAIRLGHATVPWNAAGADAETETARGRVDEAYGAARTKLDEWLKRNPKADEKTVSEKVFEISGEELRKSTRLIEPRATSSVNIKLSNYGYKSDTTPDSYSAAGIGHRNNKLIAGKSAAITKSLAARLGVSHGDEIEVETTKGTFRVFYHDTVPATDKRTGDLPETIDIYRPEDGSNSWGGKVTRISKI